MAGREDSSGSRRAPSPPVEFGRRVLIDPDALATLTGAAAEALSARGTPRALTEVLLSALTVIANLPASCQVYRPNLGNAELVAAYVRFKYRSKPRICGSLFVDRRLDLVAEDGFYPKEDQDSEGERLINSARRSGATGILVFRYFRERKYLSEFPAAAFTIHMRDKLRLCGGIRFLDYLLITPDRIENHRRIASGFRG